MTTVIISNNFNDEKSYEVDKVGDFLYSHFNEWPESAVLYQEKISKDTEIPIKCQYDVLGLNKLQGTVYVVIYPQGLFAIGALLIAGFAGIFLLKSSQSKKKSETSQREQPKAGSPNNGLSSRTNNERLNERIPDIFGKVRSIPDLLTPAYFIYKGNQEVEYSWMCIGRGEYEVTDIKDDETVIEDISGTSIEIYPPHQTPNGGTPQQRIGEPITEPLISVKQSNSVNGQTLFAPNAGLVIAYMRFIFFPDGIGVDNTVAEPVDPYNPDIEYPDISFSDNFIIGDKVTVAGAYVVGTYTVVSVTPDRIVFKNPSLVNSYWSTFDPVYGNGQYTVGFGTAHSLSVAGDRRVGPFIVENVDDVYCNVVCEGGLFKVDADDATQTQQALGIEVQVIVQQVDASDTPFGAIHTVTSQLRGSATSRSRIAVTIKANMPFSGRVQVHLRRITNTALNYEGELSDTLQWEGLLGVRNITGSDFGNVTTVRSVAYATPAALALKARKLNMQVIRKIPNRNIAGVFGPNVPTTNFADILSFVCKDAKIGNRTDAEIDFENIYETRNEITSYFGTPLAAEFNHTFDDDNLSFEEIAGTIGEAVFCSVYRQGNMIRCKFEKEIKESQLLFNHRNKLPRTEARTVSFGKLKDKDGVELSYVDFKDGARINYYIPSDRSAINPETVRQAGLNNKLVAHFHANRIWNRLQHQNTSVEFDATQEALLLGRNDKVLVADNTRTETYDGEVLAQDGLKLTLSQLLDVDTDPLRFTHPMSEAAWQYEYTAGSGWSTEIGVQDDFDRVTFRLRPYNTETLNAVVVTIRETSFDGPIVANKTIKAKDITKDHYLTVQFDSVVSSGESLFFQFQTNIVIGIFGKNVEANTDSTKMVLYRIINHDWVDTTAQMTQWLELSLSATSYTMFIQSTDATIEGIPVTKGIQANEVILSRLPRLPLVIDPNKYAPTTYEIVKNSSVRVKEFLIEERNPKSGFVSSLTCVNYDDRYYANDKDLIDGLINSDGEDLSGYAVKFSAVLNSYWRVVTMPSVRSNVTFQVDIFTNDDLFMLLCDASRYSVASNLGSSSTDIHSGAGTPLIFVDGIYRDVTMRSQVNNYLSVGAWVTVRVENIDMSAWSYIGNLFTIGSWNFEGWLRNFKIDWTSSGYWDMESLHANSRGFTAYSTSIERK